MIKQLDEISQIPFDVFWDKYTFYSPGIYDKLKAQAIWIKMQECNRILAFERLCKGHEPMREPYLFLEHFDLPFG